MRSLAVAAALFAVLAAPSALAKDFQPGDLRLCSTTRCVPVLDLTAIAALGRLYYTGPQPARALPARLGAPYLQLRFRNGYVTGIVATTRLDRFLSYGVHLERFERGAWYRVPATAEAELRRLAAPLTPMRITREALARSR